MSEAMRRTTDFNSRPSARGDRLLVLRPGVDLLISIHAPPRGATCYTPTAIQSTANFNSRPSARGDNRRSERSAKIEISIHAPPRGATRRATTAVLGADFNSRPSARGDVRCSWLKSSSSISIHAPPRGATPKKISENPLTMYFNSRPSARGDAVMSSEYGRDSFQFTPLREGRHASSATHAAPFYFNSRPSARGDATLSRRWSAESVFQFTPLREGRPQARTALGERFLFQFTPLREGRLEPVHHAPHYEHDFNSRPSARGDAATGYIGQGDKSISIHAPPRGATIQSAHGLKTCRYFNSRPSARGDKQTSSACPFGTISIHAPPRGATRSSFPAGR